MRKKVTGRQKLDLYITTTDFEIFLTILAILCFHLRLLSRITPKNIVSLVARWCNFLFLVYHGFAFPAESWKPWILTLNNLLITNWPGTKLSVSKAPYSRSFQLFLWEKNMLVSAAKRMKCKIFETSLFEATKS